VERDDDATKSLTHGASKTPKTAAIAGILFALLRLSVPVDPQEPGSWLRRDSEAVALALNLVPRELRSCGLLDAA
jgi:hypothetical protein